MTDLLEKAIALARSLPAARQDDIARLVLDAVEGDVVDLTPEQEADLAASDAEIARGEFASADELAGIWAKYAP